MFTLGAEDPAVPRLLARRIPERARRAGVQPRQPVDFGGPTGTPHQPRRRHRGHQAAAPKVQHHSNRTHHVRQDPGRDASAHRDGGGVGIPSSSSIARSTTPISCRDFLPPLLNVCERTGVRIAVENHLTVPFTADFESGGHEAERWDEGVDSLAQIKRLITDIDSPYLGVCVAPPHLWVMQETISEVVSFLMERKKLFFYYLWDIDHAYERGKDGLDFGPGEQQLPRPDGTLDFKVLLANLAAVGYEGVASMKCHGTHGWPLEYVTGQLACSDRVLSGAACRRRKQQSAG